MSIRMTVCAHLTLWIELWICDIDYSILLMRVSIGGQEKD
jgi:hypothetical protein